jgi:uncharacterized protein YeaO (DUF488 family)
VLYTKSIYSSKSDGDGLRISVMSRHTLNDGITPDPKITCDSYDLSLKILAPPDKLVGSYYKNKLCFKEYKEKYVKYLAKENICSIVEDLSKQALIKDITLLCVEESAEKCHRKILAEECQKYFPNLNVEHR